MNYSKISPFVFRSLLQNRTHNQYQSLFCNVAGGKSSFEMCQGGSTDHSYQVQQQ